MSSENIKYLIDAEDKASAKIRQSKSEVKKMVAEVKDLGGQSKASTELVGTLATQIGNTGAGQAAGEVAQLIERISAFSEVAKSGGKGVGLLKAGIVAATAVIAFKFGKAIGDQIFQTAKWRRELAHLTEDMVDMGNRGVRTMQKVSDQKFAKIELIESPAAQRRAYRDAASLAGREIATLVKKVKREREKLGSSEFEGYLWDASDEAKANQQAVLDNAKQLLELRRRQLEIAQDATGEHKKHVEQVKKMQEFRRNSNGFTDSLKEEVARLELGNEEFERRVELAEALKAGYPNINKNLLDIANQHKNIAELSKLGLSHRFVEVRKLQERKSELLAIAEAKKLSLIHI